MPYWQRFSTMSRSCFFNSAAMTWYGFFMMGQIVAAGHAAVGTPVVLQEIETPLGELLRVGRFVLVSADVTAAGPGTGRRINPGLQPGGVNLVHHALDIGELGIRQHRASRRRGTACRPASSSSSRRC